MKRKELFGVYELLKKDEMMNGMFPIKFSYALIRNKKMIEKEIKEVSALQPNLTPEFEQKRHSILDKYAKKDENGKIIWANEQAQLPLYENTEDMKKELEELEVEFKDVIDEYKKKEKEYIDFVEEEIDIKFHVIKISDCPKMIEPNYLENIEFMINED